MISEMEIYTRLLNQWTGQPICIRYSGTWNIQFAADADAGKWAGTIRAVGDTLNEASTLFLSEYMSVHVKSIRSGDSGQ